MRDTEIAMSLPVMSRDVVHIWAFSMETLAVFLRCLPVQRIEEFSMLDLQEQRGTSLSAITTQRSIGLPFPGASTMLIRSHIRNVMN